MKNRNHVKYKNLILMILGITIAIFLSKNESFVSLLLHIGKLGYIGAFLGGVLVVSSFTVGIGAVILVILSKEIPLLLLSLLAGIGALTGDLIIFKFVKDGLFNEIESIYNNIDSRHHIIKLLHTKYYAWALPVIGALIIASPLPDELGVTLLGLSKTSTPKFALISFTLNTLGILLIISAINLVI